ncbi:MAG: TolC family protein [Clostridia bacterium]
MAAGDCRRRSWGWTKGALAGALCLLLGACAVNPRPLDDADRERVADEARKGLFAGQEPIDHPLSLPEATARAIKYQAEYRQRQMEEAAAAAQLDVAKFDLLPKLTFNAGYTTRNNDAFGFGFTPAGTLATTPTSAVERTHTTSSIGLSWNLLDFGVSYYRARQLADQKLIAEEHRRKAVQTLMHDVRVAWWRAEAAERLLPGADRLLAEIEQAIEKTRYIEARKLLPPVQTATLRRALLDLSQQIAFRRQDLAQARIELAALVNAPDVEALRVASPASDQRDVPDLTAEVDKLETLALRSRPEMGEETYKARISADEARKALVGLLPALSLDLSRQHDTNKFLVNNTWTQAGINVAFNLVKVFSLPALNRSEEAQRKADDARRQAMAMAILAQTRVAAVRYGLVADEFLVWDEAAKDDDLIVRYLASSEKVGIDTELELIRARARAMASHINRDLAYANVQASMARVFNSVGYDAVPREDESATVAELAGRVERRYGELERASFTMRAAAQRPAIAAGEVSGTEPRVARLMREGIDRVLESAEMKAPDAATADVRLDVRVALEPPQEGRRSVTVSVSAAPRSSAPASLTREFKTTLSEPIDDEQWRVLGEGAAYRVLGELSPVRITRPSLRSAQRLEPRNAPAPAPAPGEPVRAPLALRLEAGLAVSSADVATAGGADR